MNNDGECRGCEGCSDCYEDRHHCERSDCRQLCERGDEHVHDVTGLPYCSRACLLLDAGEVALEDVPLCLVADHAVHVYAQYACRCEVARG